MLQGNANERPLSVNFGHTKWNVPFPTSYVRFLFPMMALKKVIVVSVIYLLRKPEASLKTQIPDPLPMLSKKNSVLFFLGAR